MKDYNELVIIIVIAIIFTIAINIFTLFVLNNSINQIKERPENEIQLESEKQDAEDKSNNIEGNNITNILKIENETNDFDTQKSIGTIKIEKISFEGQIYEGTSLDVLAKGVGHFDNSPYLDGNVCLAAHNTNKFWAKLKMLKKGDLVTYESFLGSREYKVLEITQIEETDWTKLENTNENTLTLITCVKGNKPKRLCVRAAEI